MADLLGEALRNDDLDEVRRHWDAMPFTEKWGDAGREFGVEVLRHGGPSMTERLYDVGVVRPVGPWDGFDPVVWAADHGAYLMLSSLLSRLEAPAATLRQALDAARAWLDADPEAELRRRAGDGVIERDFLVVDDGMLRVPRVRLVASGVRRAEVLLSHRAVITQLEHALDLPVTREELLARAMWSAEPESADWMTAWSEMMRRFPPAGNARWALGRIADPDLGVRRFAAYLLNILTADGDGPDLTDAQAARTALYARMPAEPDAGVAGDLIAAYAGFHPAGRILHELVPFTRDPRPVVRYHAGPEVLGGAAEAPPDVVEAVLALTRDEDPTVRRVVTASVAYAAVDTPALREALTARLTDDLREVRISAAYGLSWRGDEEALAVLRRLSDEDGDESPAWYQLDSAERQLGLR